MIKTKSTKSEPKRAADQLAEKKAAKAKKPASATKTGEGAETKKEPAKRAKAQPEMSEAERKAKLHDLTTREQLIGGISENFAASHRALNDALGKLDAVKIEELKDFKRASMARYAARLNGAVKRLERARGEIASQREALS
jgi:hypothetical protein